MARKPQPIRSDIAWSNRKRIVVRGKDLLQRGHRYAEPRRLLLPAAHRPHADAAAVARSTSDPGHPGRARPDTERHRQRADLCRCSQIAARRPRADGGLCKPWNGDLRRPAAWRTPPSFCTTRCRPVSPGKHRPAAGAREVVESWRAAKRILPAHGHPSGLCRSSRAAALPRSPGNARPIRATTSPS